MKKIATAILFLAVCLAARAQKFDYNVNFDYILGNYEYDASGERYHDSYTIHAVRLTPEVGLLLPQSKHVFHRLRVGADFVHNMGEGAPLKSLPGELILYYSLEARFPGGGSLFAAVGNYPRRYLENDSYRTVFFDDDILYQDSNLEGLMVKYSRGNRIEAELALDWSGKLGDADNPLRRERFQILTNGSWRFASDFYLSWTGSFYHYACSPTCPNVVDNHMLYPRLEWKPFTWMDEFSLSAGGFFTYQCDRAVSMKPSLPMGLSLEQVVGKWGLSLRNRLYWGEDLMPFFESSFNGQPYGRSLYFADTAFHTRISAPSWADWLSLRYEPRITKWLRAGAEFTFQLGDNSRYDGSIFRGWQQSLRLVLDLDPLRPHPAQPSKRKRFGLTL